jgi:sarcosine reductase
LSLTMAIHNISSMAPGSRTELVGTGLQVDIEELRRYLLEDTRLDEVDLEIAGPGDSFRAGYVFDILEPRAKEPGSGPDFPGILGPMAAVGRGTTHVLQGAAVTVLDGGQPGGEHGYVSRRGGMFKVLEMGGLASQATPYSSLSHLVLVPHAHPGIERHAVLNALRVASVKAAVYLAQAGLGQEPTTTRVLDLGSPVETGREGLPRVAYIGQVHGHQHGTEGDEHIVYGSNTRGMLPVLMHPNEWLDGAVVISYSWGARGLETYFHQNHPIISELYRLHQAGELTFAGAIATVSSDLQEELERNSMLAAQLAKWSLGADGAIVTKYAGGAPHSDMFETARLCEELGINTAILVSDTAPDRRAESAALMNIPGVDALVNVSEGADISWPAPPVERVLAGNPEVAADLAALPVLQSGIICGATNNQGASRLQSIIY